MNNILWLARTIALGTFLFCAHPTSAQTYQYGDFRYQFNGSTATITKYTGTNATVTIPAKFGWIPVTGIGTWAFGYCNTLTSVTLPDGLIDIGSCAFGGDANLSSVTIPNSVTNIGGSAFYECASLTSLTIPSGMTRLGVDALQCCYGLTNIVIPNNITLIEQSAFEACTNLRSITIPDSVTAIGYEAFGYCYALTNLTIPDSVAKIEGRAFENCSSLANVTVSSNLVWIGDAAFTCCPGLTGVYFKGNAPTVDGTNVFSGSDSVVVYYRPGTTGWTSTFVGRPTASWPELVLRRGTNNLVLTWSKGLLLESSDINSGSWRSNSNAHSPYAISPTESKKFYRLLLE